MSRIVLAIIILVVLLFPWHQVGIDIPVYIVNGNINMDLRYVIAGVLFIIASLTDFVDGRVARKLNASSEFGAQMDSLADFFNFGIAPGFIMYFWKMQVVSMKMDWKTK
jgi:CDP-diacylglycerol--serine O-phosphatidyltransferase